MSRKVKLLLIVFLSLPELFGLGAWVVGSYQDRANARLTTENMHTIQLALERYRTDASVYPLDMNLLTADGYLSAFPRNPYTKRTMAALRTSDSPVAGDYCYLNDSHEAAPGYPVATEYLLVAYGPKSTSREADHYSNFAGEEQLNWRRITLALRTIRPQGRANQTPASGEK